ncbi:MAG: hypothetical protein NC223_03960 [Butyrivibrio sp.]|nr:hypothetical protein [Butyrivibrio sp.]
MYFWIYYAVWILQGYALALYMDSMLTPKLKNKYISALVCTLFLLFTSYFKLRSIQTDRQTVYQLANVLGILIGIYYIILMHKDSIPKRIICVFIIYGMVLLAGAAMSLLVYEKDSSFSVNFDSTVDLLSFIAVNMCGVIFISFTAVIFCIYNKKFSQKFVWGIALFVISQFIILKIFWSAEYIKDYFVVNLISILGIFAEYSADIVLFFVIESEGEQESMRRDIQAVRHAMELENVRYEVLYERQQELAKLRHDYNNQLIVVQLLLESGNGAEAREIAAELRIRLRTQEITEV